jgi:peroxin-1
LNTKHVFGETVKIPPATKEIRAKVRLHSQEHHIALQVIEGEMRTCAKAQILHQLIADLPPIPTEPRHAGKVNGTSHPNGDSHDLDHEHEHKVLDYVTLASMTDGYMVTDMKDLVSGAMQQAIMRAAKTGTDSVSSPCPCSSSKLRVAS